MTADVRLQTDRMLRALGVFDGSVIRVSGDTVSITGIEPCGRTVAEIVRQVADDEVLAAVGSLDLGIRHTVEGVGPVAVTTSHGVSDRVVRLLEDLLGARERLVAGSSYTDVELEVRVVVGGS